jgi:uncharacterized protein
LGQWVQRGPDNVGQPLHRCLRIYRRLMNMNVPNSGEFAVNPPDRKPPSAADIGAAPAPQPLADADIARLEALLDSLPAPLQPLDVCALDGFLCGVLLQPRRPGPDHWLPHVFDIEARPAPAGKSLDELRALVLRRHAELDHAISTRQWFDPWIYQLAGEGDDAEDGAPPNECMLPWVAGFAAAMEAYPDLMAMTDPELVEPLALVFMHFAPEDLEDADALLAVIETLEPASDLAEAVQDLVRALMLMADVTRPQGAAPKSNKANKANAPKRSNTPHGPARSFSQNRRR